MIFPDCRVVRTICERRLLSARMNPEKREWLAFAGRVLGMNGDTAGMKMSAITKGGSDRTFYRLSPPGGKTFLFMSYGRRQQENAYWTGIAAFLAALGVPVPAVYGHDPERGFVLMEDLGDRDLWSYRHEPWELRRRLYRQALRRISPLYTFPLPTDRQETEGISGRAGGRGRGTGTPPGERGAGLSLPRTMPGYDRELYRWEHDYFLAEFVREVCGISLTGEEEGPLREELSALSGRLLASGPALVHRDLQSQNIMIRRGEPVFIDFQGLRRGSLFYDLGSLLYDSYVPFTEDEREDLLRYAFELTGRRGRPMQTVTDGDSSSAAAGADWPTFRARFLDGSAQRLMQALGAFGFLGLKKGKTPFLGHIPRGVANLCEAAAGSGRLPRLLALAERCREKVPEVQR